MRNRTGGRGGPAHCAICDPHYSSLCGRLDTSLVKATVSLGSLGPHSNHLQR